MSSNRAGKMVEQTTHILTWLVWLVGEVEQVYAISPPQNEQLFRSWMYVMSVIRCKFASGWCQSGFDLLNWPHRIGLHLFSEGMALEISLNS
ncbi:MAG: hypothetical protein U0350_17345 [Caldilineaceae bacterium]